MDDSKRDFIRPLVRPTTANAVPGRLAKKSLASNKILIHNV
mgnify:CR=1 FL=1